MAERACVGRDTVLEQLLAVADPNGPDVVYVWGPGGIGKSTLLRALGARLAAAGRRVVVVDGRDSGSADADLAAALDALDGPGDGVVMLDSYEHVPGLGPVLREAATARRVRVVAAGRRGPEAEWHVLGPRLLTIELDPLDHDSARELVALHGVPDPAGRERVAAWADGLPLALTVAAAAIARGQPVDLDHLDADGMVASALLAQIAGDELSGHDPDVIAVAAIARAVDARMLAGVLPGVDGDHAEAWLRGLSFAQPLGLRATLHERVRQAVRSALKAQDAERERELRRRIADHLHARTAMGEQRLFLDLGELIDDEAVRYGLAPPPSSFRADTVRDGDEALLAAAAGAVGTRWWAGVSRWFSEGREQVMVIRDGDGAVAGCGIWLTPERAPAWADEDAIVGPWLAHAREHAPEGNVLMLRDVFDLAGNRDARSPVVTVGNHAVLQRIDLARARYMYLPVFDGAGGAYAAALGYVEVPELEVQDGERRVGTYMFDNGPGGALGLMRDLIYRDLQIDPPARSAVDAVAEDMVRDALRSFRDPAMLASSPLARGGTVEARAASMRRLLTDAVAGAFGDSAEEGLKRQAIQRGYLDGDGGHAVAQAELHVTRSVYFRRLAHASARVGAYVRSGSA